MIRSLWRELPLLVDKAVPNIDIDNSCLLKQWADAAAADKAAAAAGAATAANSAAEKRRLGSLFTIWQCAGAYRRIAAHQRCGRARVSRALGSPPRALSLATWQNYARFRQFFSVLVSWNVPIRMGVVS